MREIIKTVSLPVDGKPTDFRLTKPDAFSGVFLLRLLASLPEHECAGDAGGLSGLLRLPEGDLQSLLRLCLEHTEVLLPAGWNPVMAKGEWTYPEISRDTPLCLKLALEEALWALEGFFAGGGSASRTESPAT